MSAQTLLRFSTAGSVDDGKSTLIGRLLFDSRAVMEDQVATLARTTVRHGGKGLDGFRRRRLPVRNAAADLGDEILEQPLSVLGVRDFGVELHAEHAKLVVGHGGNGAIFGRPEHFETVWQRVNRIAVADPHAAVDRKS